MPGGGSQRVAERLRRLRLRFGDKVRERQVDHDHEHVTGTRFEQIPVRTFFLGEVWWVDRVCAGRLPSAPRGQLAPSGAGDTPAGSPA